MDSPLPSISRKPRTQLAPLSSNRKLGGISGPPSTGNDVSTPSKLSSLTPITSPSSSSSSSPSSTRRRKKRSTKGTPDHSIHDSDVQDHPYNGYDGLNTALDTQTSPITGERGTRRRKQRNPRRNDEKETVRNEKGGTPEYQDYEPEDGYDEQELHEYGDQGYDEEMEQPVYDDTPAEEMIEGEEEEESGYFDFKGTWIRAEAEDGVYDEYDNWVVLLEQGGEPLNGFYYYPQEEAPPLFIPYDDNGYQGGFWNEEGQWVDVEADQVGEQLHPDQYLDEDGYPIEDEQMYQDTTGSSEREFSLPTPQRGVGRAVLDAEQANMLFPGHDIEDYDAQITKIFINRAERLFPDLKVTQPLVRVHIVDQDSGTYLKKSVAERNVVTQYEQAGALTKTSAADSSASSSASSASNPMSMTMTTTGVDFILPFMTKPFPFKGRRTYAPKWKEEFVLNEEYLYLLRKNVLILFELMDMSGVGMGGSINDGWYHVAWGFFKPVSSTGVANTESEVRLQLYQYPRKVLKLAEPQINSKSVPRAYWAWVDHKKRERYPATMFITMSATETPESRRVTTHPKNPFEREQGRLTLNQMRTHRGNPLDLGAVVAGSGDKHVDSMEAMALWTKIPNEPSKIPNNVKFRFQTGAKGCFTLAFSHNGRLLAGACVDEDSFPIKIWDVISGRIMRRYNGHHDLVYELTWSDDDRFLASASSDNTVMVWSVAQSNEEANRGRSASLIEPQQDGTGEGSSSSSSSSSSDNGNEERGKKGSESSSGANGDGMTDAFRILHHTSFVYTVQFRPDVGDYMDPEGDGNTAGMIAATGAYDRKVVVWDVASRTVLAKLKGHKSHVNTVAFGPAGLRLVSGDGDGVIRVWSCRASGDIDPTRWEPIQTVKLPELPGNPINQIKFFPNGKRMMVHSRDNQIRVVDVRAGFHVVRKYDGHVNYRYRSRGDMSTEGLYVVTGSEDGNGFIWNTDTGKRVRTFNLGYSAPVTEATWHPMDHMVAVCCLSVDQPVMLLNYQPDPNAPMSGDGEVVEGAVADKEEATEETDEQRKERALQQKMASLMSQFNLKTDAKESLPESARGESSLSNGAFGASSSRSNRNGGGVDATPRSFTEAEVTARLDAQSKGTGMRSLRERIQGIVEKDTVQTGTPRQGMEVGDGLLDSQSLAKLRSSTAILQALRSNREQFMEQHKKSRMDLEASFEEEEEAERPERSGNGKSTFGGGRMGDKNGRSGLNDSGAGSELELSPGTPNSPIATQGGRRRRNRNRSKKTSSGKSNRFADRLGEGSSDAMTPEADTDLSLSEDFGDGIEEMGMGVGSPSGGDGGGIEELGGMGGRRRRGNPGRR
eukprot:TRINITY_DN3323_c1_g1_i1.p1 TRINITY_DN3323_c1_g1~~TRINITY_DN3323_c1_g1_i1.p1  ORF type:complete len:1401 (-),score=415.80 TRINITY_DN3323_c1_g1_i1:1330-5343(-)